MDIKLKNLFFYLILICFAKLHYLNFFITYIILIYNLYLYYLFIYICKIFL